MAQNDSKGRRKGVKNERDVVRLARKHTTAAIRILAALMKDENAQPFARIKAAETLLNRGWGSAPKRVDVINHLTPAQIKQAAREILLQRQERENVRKPIPEQPQPEIPLLPEGRSPLDHVMDAPEPLEEAAAVIEVSLDDE